jgi:hypothetical protein
MVNIRALYSPKDLRLPFVCQEEQRKEFDLNVLKEPKLLKFVMENEKETLAIFWFWNLGGGRVSVGSFLSQNCGEYFREMQRLIERLFKFYNATRYEALVKTDFENGHRMIKILGFEREGTMKKFFDGKDFDLYARVIQPGG